MAAKLTRLTQKIAIQMHVVSESCTICSYRSMRPVRKLLDTPSYFITLVFFYGVEYLDTAQPPRWRTALRWLSAAAYSVYSHLPSIACLKAVSSVLKMRTRHDVLTMDPHHR
jgi:hypothetical protein